MSVSTPHYSLFSKASRKGDSGRWRFVLRSADGSEQLEAADEEPTIRGERLDLLTVVRGLEALDQPSRVTVIGCSPYVRQGMRYGLSEWRSNGWRWEFFGEMVPVKNGDLWQRLDRALRFHRVDCRRRFDPPHRPFSVRKGSWGQKSCDFGIRVAPRRWLRYGLSLVSANFRRRITAKVRRWRRRVFQSWRALVPCPWGG